MHFIVTNASGLAIWTHVDTYGTSPGCNLNSSVKFVVLGHSVAATNRGLRKFAIFTFALGVIPIPFYIMIVMMMKSCKDTDDEPDPDPYPDELTWLNWMPTIPACVIWVYGVATVEEIIQRNGLSHETSQWTYGQTFAVVLMVGSVIDLGSALRRCIVKIYRK